MCIQMEINGCFNGGISSSSITQSERPHSSPPQSSYNIIKRSLIVYKQVNLADGHDMS